MSKKKNTVSFLNGNLVSINGNKLKMYKENTNEFKSTFLMFITALSFEGKASKIEPYIKKSIEFAGKTNSDSGVKRVLNDVIFNNSNDTTFVADPTSLLNRFNFT